jgi:hypothetical protein
MTLPKLNLRDLFWLVVVVAMGLGWYWHGINLWLENAFLRQELRLCEEELAKLREPKD